MGLGLGLRLGLGGAGVLGPALDPDAMAWFEAVEATGATFGPDSATVDANKTAWSNWVIAQKNAESPIAGRSNWDQLTEPGEGYIQPLMGVNTFDIPAMFGDSDFINFVVGDYDPATGLRGGEDRAIDCGRRWGDTPISDVSAGALLTEAPDESSLTGRIVGDSSLRDFIANNGNVRNRGDTTYNTPTLFNASVPLTVALSRFNIDGFQVISGDIFEFSAEADVHTNSLVLFFNSPNLNRESDARMGLTFYGRSINLEAMNTACVALSEAIVWPT